MRLRFFLPMTLATALAALTACGDDVTDPDGLIESAEAEAVVRSAEALPLLPTFLEPAADAGERERATLVRARELWDAGSAIDDPRGSARRRRAVGYALPVLLESVPPEDWAAARTRMEDWLVTASTMMRHLSMPQVEQRLAAATRQLARADRAGSEHSRVYYLLLAGSELVETTPRFVARSMAREAEGAVGRARAAAGDDLPVASLERAERLKDWSTRAVEEGDYLLAIQRAYYAIQLVEAP